VAESEQAFNSEMERRQVHKIGPHETDKRQLYYMPSIGGHPRLVAPTHLWSAAFYLERHQWAKSCARCELLHKSMVDYEVAGQRCVEWKKNLRR
jgi:hypothetical protein